MVRPRRREPALAGRRSGPARPARPVVRPGAGDGQAPVAPRSRGRLSALPLRLRALLVGLRRRRRLAHRRGRGRRPRRRRAARGGHRARRTGSSPRSRRWASCSSPSAASPPRRSGRARRCRDRARHNARMSRDPDMNVVGGELLPCSGDPLTGFYRDGCCATGPEDVGSHTVCAVMTAEFLAFSAMAGNDLSTPRPEWGFPGLSPGDRWCVCAARWLEAQRRGLRPGRGARRHACAGARGGGDRGPDRPRRPRSTPSSSAASGRRRPGPVAQQVAAARRPRQAVRARARDAVDVQAVVEAREDDLQAPVAVEVGDRGGRRDADAVSVRALVAQRRPRLSFLRTLLPCRRVARGDRGRCRRSPGGRTVGPIVERAGYTRRAEPRAACS